MPSEIEDPTTDRYRKIMRGLHKIGFTRFIMRLGMPIYAKATKLDPKKYNLYAIGQSHLDSAWNWRWAPDTAPYKLSHTVGYNFCNFKIFKARKLKTHFGGYKFAFSSPAHYEYIEKNYPFAFKHIQKLVKEGRWELVGGMWVEADVHAPDGESLVRQRLYGQRYYLEKFGKISLLEWLPDCFGFGNSLPQILVKSGSPYFHTTKITWNLEHEFPFYWFYWMSPDGSYVLASNFKMGFRGLEKISLYEKNARLIDEKYLDNKVFDSSMDVYNDPRFSKEHVTDYLWTFGQGDGGHGPWQIECILADTLEQINRMQLVKASLFYKLIEKKYAKRLPIWKDELFLEVHHGCQTTLYRLKKQNRLAEIYMQIYEKMSVLSTPYGYEFPKAEYDAVWKKILFNHFHDILPGSSIQEVYEDSDRDFSEYFPKLLQWQDQIFQKIASIQNPTLNIGDLIIFFPIQSNKIHKIPFNYREYDKRFPTEPRYIFVKPKTDYLIGFETITKENIEKWVNQTPKIQYERKENSILVRHPEFVVEFNIEKATIQSLTLAKNATEIVNPNGKGLNIFRIFHDLPKGNDAWNLEPDYRDHELDLVKVNSHKIKESQQGIIIEFEIKIGENSQARLIYEVFPLIDYIDVHLEINWKEEHKLLRTEFETAISSDKYTTGQPYGSIHRPTQPKMPIESGKWEVPGQYFIDIHEDSGKGLSVFVKNRYGFDCQGSRLGLSLLRAPAFEPPDKSACKWYDPKTEPNRLKIKDQGVHILDWAIFPYDQKSKSEEVYGRAINYAYIPIYKEIDTNIQEKHQTPMNSGENIGFIVNNPNIFFSVAKFPYEYPAKKGIIMRFIELLGKNQKTPLRWPQSNEENEIIEVDLLEMKKKFTIHQDTNEKNVEIYLNPFEIKSFLLK
jgi:alpha-mannosidase